LYIAVVQSSNSSSYSTIAWDWVVAAVIIPAAIGYVLFFVVVPWIVKGFKGDD